VQVPGLLAHPPLPPLHKGGNRRAPAAAHLILARKKHPLLQRRGVTLVEVIVVICIIIVALLFLLMMIPQGREQARLLGCQKNLGQIGVALAMYDQLQRQLPAVGTLPGVDDDIGSTARSSGPLRSLLEALQQPDLSEMKDPQMPVPPRPGQVPTETRVPGFFCSSDPNALAGRFVAPVSYRATTGGSPAGDDGPFAIGQLIRLADVEAADGSGYTAGFSERLVGDHQSAHPSPWNYQVVPGPLSGSGCPATDDPAKWRGDAGATWSWSDYRHTLYNHALPLSSHHSCLAVDGKTAFMGASSGHVRGINLLLLDGRVSLVTRDIDLKVWKEFATIHRSEQAMPRRVADGPR
jgi:type II secretory pathway pseudopilin PulG